VDDIKKDVLGEVATSLAAVQTAGTMAAGLADCKLQQLEAELVNRVMQAEQLVEESVAELAADVERQVAGEGLNGVEGYGLIESVRGAGGVEQRIFRGLSSCGTRWESTVCARP